MKSFLTVKAGGT